MIAECDRERQGGPEGVCAKILHAQNGAHVQECASNLTSLGKPRAESGCA